MATDLGITFKETMSGGFRLGATDPHAGQKAGEKAGSHFVMHGVISIDNLATFIASDNHAASLRGTVEFTPFGGPIDAPTGIFKLFAPTENPELKLMVYQLGFEHQGKSYYMAGQKNVRDDPVFDLWKQTTTLYTQLHEGTSTSDPVVAAGVLSLGVRQLIDLVSTFHTTGEGSGPEKTEAIAKFGRFFMGELWDSYVLHLPNTQ